MKLSIILPTYNCANKVRRAIDSIVGQSFADWELLVMDGLSTDGTTEIVLSYNDPRIQLISEKDNGIYDAMNKGILSAQGEWLYFIGSDDYLLNDTCLKRLFDNPISNYDVVYGDVEANLHPEASGEWTIKTLDHGRCHQGIFYRKSVFNLIGLYDTRYIAYADTILNLHWFGDRRIKKCYIPMEIAHYSTDGFSGTHRDVEYERCFAQEVLKCCFSQLDCYQRVYFIREALCHGDLSITNRFFLHVALIPCLVIKKIHVIARHLKEQ